MNYPLINKTIGMMLLTFALILIIPMTVSLAYSDENILSFVYSFLIILFFGSIMYFPNLNGTDISEIKTKEGFLIVVMFWVSLSFFGSFPFVFDKDLSMSLSNAFFESVSGWTTTGATVIVSLDNLSPSILIYRQLLQWFGGMGIVVLALAILPMLGVGGMQLYKAESTGPIKDNKISPRIAETAQNLWRVYLGLTILCALLYYLAGMTMFDAVAHSFSTIAIGGFSTHSASIAYFQNIYIEMVCMIFMMLSALNFILHFLSLKNKSLRVYLEDSESKLYFAIILGSIFLLSFYSYFNSSQNISIADLIFQIISFITTSGFVSTSYSEWPFFIISILVFLSFIGACAGSTGGGIKVIRILFILKQLKRGLLKIIHPSAEVPVKINNQVVTDDVSSNLSLFFIFYLISYIILSLILMFSGLDATSAFSSTAACLNNLGPGAGTVIENYNSLSIFSKSVLTFAMLLGRLEIYTLLIIFTPYFWKY
tara:strand:- start:3271 stop:4719 length:1449 start_codon:yes stop_codon:yes gene_type:complete